MRLAALLGCVATVLLGAGGVLAARDVGSPTNLHRLPLGDGKTTLDGPKRGYVYSCGLGPGGGGAFAAGPWIHGSTFDETAKAVVAGAVAWPQAKVSFTRVHGRMHVSGNGLPVGIPTGTFPIAAGTAAYSYDRNPNSIEAQPISWLLPAPSPAHRPGCLGGGAIGIALDGVPIFDALDAEGRDAVAHEVQDSCGGHPQVNGEYHYHEISPCLLKGESTTSASPLVGYALDGYPIYGPRGPGGRLYTDADLDACHGHVVNGHYRYQATLEYPYTLGCFHGTPLRLRPPRP